MTRKLAVDRFNQWLTATGWSQTEAAEKIGCAQTFISAMKRGDRLPGRRIAHAIERLSASWTEGPIRTEEWDAAEEAEPPRKLAAGGVRG